MGDDFSFVSPTVFSGIFTYNRALRIETGIGTFAQQLLVAFLVHGCLAFWQY